MDHQIGGVHKAFEAIEPKLGKAHAGCLMIPLIVHARADGQRSQPNPAGYGGFDLVIPNILTKLRGWHSLAS
jgi:hypothetical protein